MRNVFISFLGTSDYVPCNYYLESEKDIRIENVKYIQEALIKIHQEVFNPGDKIITFCTESSYKSNYLDDGLFNAISKKNDLPNNGLATRLNQMNFSAGTVEHKIIKEGFSEAEIWDVFNAVNQVVNERDNIYFDITHAFRYLPMMGLVLLNYLKVTKNIRINGLYYGAFEKLGFAGQVRNMSIEERNAPILNLLPLIHLNDWTQATQNFVSSGNTSDLSILLSNSGVVQFRSVSQKRQNQIREQMRQFSNQLKTLTGVFTTNRGKEIISADVFLNLKASIENVSEIITNRTDLAPFKELLEQIENKISNFKHDEIWNGFIAVEWCIKHKLIQQGITLFQEFMISYVLFKINYNVDNKSFRNTTNAYLSLRNNIEFNYTKDLKEIEIQKNIIDKISILDNLNEIKVIFEDLTRNRNDIQHAGFNQNPKEYNDFEKSLVLNYKKFKKLTHASQPL